MFLSLIPRLLSYDLSHLRNSSSVKGYRGRAPTYDNLSFQLTSESDVVVDVLTY